MRVLCLGVLMLVGCDRPLPESLAASAAEQVKKARAQADEKDAEWRAAMIATTAAPGSRPCALLPPSEAVTGKNGDRISGVYGAATSRQQPVALVAKGEFVSAHSPRWRMANERLEMIEYELRPDRRFDADALERAKREIAEAATFASADFWSHDFVVFIDDEVEAKLAGSGETTNDGLLNTTRTAFTPGHATGRGYVYDYRRHRVACASRFTATNASHIESLFGDGAQWQLRYDLEGASVAAAARALQEVR